MLKLRSCYVANTLYDRTIAFAGICQAVA
ncbi:high frequency lysogenization protein HflD, partial [Vibrio parahaemolyticus]